MKVVAVAGEAVTGYGLGMDALWQGVCSGKTAIRPMQRFPADQLVGGKAVCWDALRADAEESLVMQMVCPLLDGLQAQLEPSMELVLATTTGEIDLLERVIDGSEVGVADSRLQKLLKKINARCGGLRHPLLISAACASGSAAIAHAAGRIQMGRADAVLVVACDAVSEFVFSGFSALGALDAGNARPFDRQRAGLTIGDGAGYVLLMSENRARRDSCSGIGSVAGWGLSNDANHMTGPSRDGEGLARAVKRALNMAGVSPGQIGSIGLHGTGTRYNDAMEIKAMQSVFDCPVPAYSVKGATGHTMGASGLIEALVAWRSLREDVVPGTIGLVEPEEDAADWVDAQSLPGAGQIALSTNSGFGGVNAALVLGTA